jgi:thioredoxin reductase (NADPH)
MTHDVIVIGAGFAGLTAATRLAEQGKRVALLESLGPGGELMTLGTLADAPGETAPISGPDLAGELLNRALTAGVDVRFDEALALAPGTPHAVEGSGGTCSAPAVIIATGCAPARLGVPGEDEFEGRGVSYCVSCDGPLLRGAPVVLVAGGAYAPEEARELAEHASTVTVLAPTDDQRLHGVPNITLLQAAPTRILGGDHGVNGVAIAFDDGESVVPARGIFVCAGGVPRTEFLAGAVDCDEHGHVTVDPMTLQTSILGIHAIGDVRTGSDGTLAGAAADVATVVTALAPD